MKPEIRIKRAYDKPFKKDGRRILVDRLWPRGLSKEAASIDEWAKDLAPSPGLRKWFGHDPELWDIFQKKYRVELKNNSGIDDFMENHKDERLITLIYGARDSEHTHALTLQQFLQQYSQEGFR